MLSNRTNKISRTSFSGLATIYPSVVICLFSFFVCIFLQSNTVYANTTGSGAVFTGTSIQQKQTVFTMMRTHLDMQKNNLDALLATEDKDLEQKKSVIANFGEQQNVFETLSCIGVPGISTLDRTNPINSIVNIIVKDYLALRTRIYELEVRQSLGLPAPSSDEIDTLQIQIENFGESYQRMIVQLVQKTQDRFASNTQSVSNFLRDNQQMVQNIMQNKQRIQTLVGSYDTLQDNLRSSRLLFGFSLQEAASTKALMKNKVRNGIADILDKRIQTYTRQYQFVLPLPQFLATTKANVLRSFDTSYETRYNDTIGKFAQEAETSVLDSQIQSVRSLYFKQDKTINCSILANITNQDAQLFDALQQQIDAFARNTVNTTVDMSPLSMQEQRKTRKNQFLSSFDTFYRNQAKIILTLFNSIVSDQLGLYVSVIRYETNDLSMLNERNELYRNTENIAEKERLQNEEIIPLGRGLAMRTIHKGTRDRALTVLGAMGFNVASLSLNNQSNTIETSPSQSSSTVVQQVKINDHNATIQSYVKALEEQYPEVGARKIAIQETMKSVVTTLQNGNISADQKQMYLQLYMRLKTMMNT